MQLSQREKIAVTIAGVCLVFFVLAQFGVFPLLDNRKRAVRSLAAKQRQLAEMQEMSQRYASFSKKNDSIAELLQQRAAGFSLFSFLEKNAAKSKVKDHISYMKPSELTSKLLKQSMVEMKLQAVSIKQLVHFLKMTESPHNLVGIRRIAIQQNAKEKGALDIIMQIVSVDGLDSSG